MRIRFLVSIASPDWGFGPGQEADFPEVEAISFIAGGHAVAVEAPEPDIGPAEQEAAAVGGTPEESVKPNARKRAK